LKEEIRRIKELKFERVKRRGVKELKKRGSPDPTILHQYIT
jgi:hypothetical protein